MNPAPGLPAGTQIVTNSTIPGRLAICVTSPTAMSAGAQDLVGLSASVPMNAPYRSRAALQVQVVAINGSTSQGSGDQAVQDVTFIGNATGSGNYNGNDISLIRQVLVSPDVFSGYTLYPLVDPLITGNVSATGNLNASDASILGHYLTSSDVIPQIPAYTGPPSGTATGPDPKLFLPRTLAGMPGDTLTAPVRLLQTSTAPIGLQSFSLVIAFDPSSSRVSGIRPGDLAAGFRLTERVDPAQGLIFITGTGSRPLMLAPGALGDLVRLDFTVLASAKPGSFAINLLGNSGTSVTSLDGGGLTLVPAPSNAGDDAVDGPVAIGGRRTQAAFRPGGFLAFEEALPSASRSPVPDLAIHSLAVDPGEGPTGPSGFIPLTLDDLSDDPSSAVAVPRPRTVSTDGAAAVARRVAFRHHALTRIVAAADTSN